MNAHTKNYPSKVIETTYFNHRSIIFKNEFEMKTLDKRTKEYKDLEEQNEFSKQVMPQLKEAYKLLTGEDIQG